MSAALSRFPLRSSPAAFFSARRRRPAVHAPAGWRCRRAAGPALGGGGGSVALVKCVGENRSVGGYGGAVVGEDVEVASIGTLGIQGLSLFLLLLLLFFAFLCSVPVFEIYYYHLFF